MKKIIALILALMLSLAIPCAMAEALPAEEARYTHPTQGYSFVVPEGWLMLDATNIDAYIAAYEKGEMTFTGTNAQTLQNLKPQVQGTDCGVLINPYANNAVFVKEDMGIEMTNEQFATIMVPMMKTQLLQQNPTIEFTDEVELLPFGENTFILLSGSYNLNGISASIDMLFLLQGTSLYTVNLTTTSLFGDDLVNAFYTDVFALLGTFATEAE